MEFVKGLVHMSISIRHIRIVFLALVLLPIHENHLQAAQDTDSLSYLQAKEEAELMGKPYLLYFHADWCAPCKWMTETTLADSMVMARLDTEVLFVGLDIDAFEGYALKSYFDVQTLPTFILFNPRHEIVNRASGALSATGLTDFLDGRLMTEPIATRPPKPTLINIASPRPKAIAGIQDLPDVEHLPIDIVRQVTTYTAQVGAFHSLASAQGCQDSMRRLTDQPVRIHTIYRDGLPTFKVCIGQFDREEDARNFIDLLHERNIPAFMLRLVSEGKG